MRHPPGRAHYHKRPDNLPPAREKMMDEFTEAFLETEWLWDTGYEDYEPNPYDGTYQED